MPRRTTLTDSGEQYSEWIGLAFVFNLIVGTGVLAIPASFERAGWLLGLVILIILGFMSYLTMTFVVEVLAASNALLTWRRLSGGVTPPSQGLDTAPDAQNNGNTVSAPPTCPRSAPGTVEGNAVMETSAENAPLLHADKNSERVSLSDLYTINQRVEMGKMASIFFGKFGNKLFYLCLCIYLFGDLSIYSAAISKTLRDVSCNYVPAGFISNGSASLPSSLLCNEGIKISRQGVYWLYLMGFTLVVSPFVFIDLQKTKALQISTTSMRSLAFFLMILLASIHLAQGKGRSHAPVAKLSGMPYLFGVCVYCFMCHHSIPSLVTPISNKHSILKLIGLDYILILFFYILVGLTGLFSFTYVHDLYTLNFFPTPGSSSYDNATNIVFLQYLIALFPVFTLSTNFPIIAVTLRNNLKALFLSDGGEYGLFVDRILFPLVVLFVPTLIAFVTNDIQLLIGITGSYPGTGVQYIIPALLVYRARKKLSEEVGDSYKNQHSSPFRHNGWVVFVFIWSFICVSFITVNFFIHDN